MTTANPELELTIQRLENRRYDAMTSSNIDTLRELCDEELTYTHSNAERDTKTSYLEKVASGHFAYEEIEHPIHKIVVIGDLAIVIGEMRCAARVDGVPRILDNSSLAVWVRRDEHWSLIAYQPTPMPR